jgi:hypothetical protein
MNWSKLFGKTEILTAADRSQLEAIDASAEDLRQLETRISEHLVVAQGRQARIMALATALAEDPGNRQLFDDLRLACAMPSHPATGYQHRDWALGAVAAKIEERLRPQHAIVRRVLRRGLEAAEAELARSERRERGEADEGGFEYSPSGKIVAIQRRIRELRNAVAQPIPGEDGCIQPPAPWRDRLRDFL